ncbi:MAG: nicotinamide-nucleotide amidohydrolase family protein, partial [Deltaproteobacteria bacterium]|nr:nicotinamide-nucleotide amidohydrolase family protein [Deltaproteobacteria bacterium]
LAPRVVRRSHQIHLRTFGRSESDLADALEGIEQAHPGVTLGYRAHFPEIELKVLARADDELAAEQLATEVAEELRRRLGRTIFGERDDTFPGVVGRELRERGLSLALAESCTGGLVGAKLTSVPGSSEFLLLDAVVYANSAKEKLLGVRQETLRGFGAVSAETAAQMADGARRVAAADLAISITGIAGPGGGTDEKPVGTVYFGVARAGARTHTFLRNLPGDRERIRELAAYVAMESIRRAAGGERLPGAAKV